MMINDVIARKVVSARPEDTLSAVARLMREHNVGAVIVADDRRPVGIVTDRDLALALGAQGASLNAPVRQVMSPHVLAVPETTTVLTATRFMKERGVRRLPVVDDDDRVVGLISLDDLFRLLIQELHNLAEGIKHEVAPR